MPNPQTNTKESLARLIQSSGAIGESEKEEFLALLPSLQQNQIDELTEFFTSAENELAKAKAAYHEKESQIYDEFVPKMNGAFESARQMVHTTALMAKFKNP
jgi:hypothetical protein